MEVKGHKLTCPICGSEHFQTRRYLLNTMWLTFFEWDWANKQAQTYSCDNCGYIMWFRP